MTKFSLETDSFLFQYNQINTLPPLGVVYAFVSWV